jgi:hypothetical protein
MAASSLGTNPTQHLRGPKVVTRTSSRGPIEPSRLNGAVHDWYRSILGYSAEVVSQELDRLHIEKSQKILDPFCGSGTTLVECMKRGIGCVGIDANPASEFATRVKTDWSLKGATLAALCENVKDLYSQAMRFRSSYRQDATYIYLESSGMLERGWMSPQPLQKAIAIKSCIRQLKTGREYADALMLALIAEVTYSASNVRFGPELYCGETIEDYDVLAGFCERVDGMASDLDKVRGVNRGEAQVYLGDSRYCSQTLRNGNSGPHAAVICSPPYPTEHDYTRNARLELVFLEHVLDRESLRKIKRTMIRSHTKGIYKLDSDSKLVGGNRLVQKIVNTLRRKVRGKDHGFARLYPKVVEEYFGGMKRHLMSVKSVVAPMARCTYIVGDQSSYLRVHIPTADILSSIAEEEGFKTVEIRHWRKRWSTTTSRELDENILVLEAPEK